MRRLLTLLAFLIAAAIHGMAQPAQDIPGISGISEKNVHNDMLDTWWHIVESHRTETIYAFYGTFLCPTGARPHLRSDVLEDFGLRPPILPHGQGAVQIATSEAPCRGTVDTLVFADGTYIGDPQHYRRIVVYRRGLALQLPSILQALEEVALGKHNARELASQLTFTADTLPIGEPVNWLNSARRNVLLYTANLLVRQELPGTPAIPRPADFPSIEHLVHTMHVTPEQAHAADLLRLWTEWSHDLKAYAPNHASSTARH